MLLRSVSFMSQLIRNWVLFISQICHVQKWLRLNCEGSATSSRRVWDNHDEFATILRGILSHKIFEHVQNFRNYFAPLGDTCEEITNHWQLFRDCFATHSRCLSPVVAVQWDRGFKRTNKCYFKNLYINISLTKCIRSSNVVKFSCIIKTSVGWRSQLMMTSSKQRNITFNCLFERY